MISITHIQATQAASATEPVSLADAKLWATVDHTDDDTLLTDMLIGARQDIEGLTNRKLVATDVEIHFSTGGKPPDWVKLPYGGSATVVVNDDAGALATTKYKFKAGRVFVYAAGDYSLTYTTGSSVPEALKEAVKMLVAYRYNNRGDQEKQMGIPEDVKAKVRPYVEEYL